MPAEPVAIDHHVVERFELQSTTGQHKVVMGFDTRAEQPRSFGFQDMGIIDGEFGPCGSEHTHSVLLVANAVLRAITQTVEDEVANLR